jgi:nitrite reductase/ring-hydroxylating ferredoxin subunit
LSEPTSTDFQSTLPGNQVRANRISMAEVGLQRVVLTRIEGQLCAFNALCPHQLGNLASGSLVNGEIECPVHNWRFNIRTGKSVYPEDDGLRLRRYHVQEENGLVLVSLRPLVD